MRQSASMWRGNFFLVFFDCFSSMPAAQSFLAFNGYLLTPKTILTSFVAWSFLRGPLRRSVVVMRRSSLSLLRRGRSSSACPSRTSSFRRTCPARSRGCQTWWRPRRRMSWLGRHLFSRRSRLMTRCCRRSKAFIWRGMLLVLKLSVFKVSCYFYLWSTNFAARPSFCYPYPPSFW